MAKKLSEKIRAARKKPGGSAAGTYKRVKKFAGPAGGAPAGTFPINTLKRAKSALSYARNAPNPKGLQKKVYKTYPKLAGSAHAKKVLGKIKGLKKK